MNFSLLTRLVGTMTRKRREVPGKVKVGGSKLYNVYAIENNMILPEYQGKKKIGTQTSRCK